MEAACISRSPVNAAEFNRKPFVDHLEWVSVTFVPANINPPVLGITVAADEMGLTSLATSQVTRLLFVANRRRERECRHAPH